MKSISDIRRENLTEVIRRYFDDNQTRMAESMGVQQSVISRWVKGHRNVGNSSARKIEEVSGRPKYWLDTDHVLSLKDSREPQEYEARSFIGEVAAENLRRWMLGDSVLNSQQRVGEKAGIAQATVQRLLSKEASTTIGTLAAIADAFGRQAFELLVPKEHPGIINYDHARFAALPDSEKEKVRSFIEFILQQNQ
ncbi:helix-turn-helix domain-containing protein [Cedecea davisae]|uniref:helix-turn-helix domain-containing protein n=1 Tax=Cedecea davisae TaxID=158484 RepID=UPI00376EA38A